MELINYFYASAMMLLLGIALAVAIGVYEVIQWITGGEDV